MDDQSYRDLLRAALAEKAEAAVTSTVADSGGRAITEARTALLARLGTNGIKSEPLACLEAARELERAAHDMQLSYIRLARETGRTWYEIGHALDLFLEAAAGDDSIADVAYDRLRRYNPRWEKQDFTWTCPACQQIILDHGPWPDIPQQEEGHAPNCERRTDQLAAWHRDPNRWPPQ